MIRLVRSAAVVSALACVALGAHAPSLSAQSGEGAWFGLPLPPVWSPTRCR